MYNNQQPSFPARSKPKTKMRKIKLLIFLMPLAVFSCQEDKLVYNLEPHKYLELTLVENDSTFYIEQGRDHYKDNRIYNDCYEITYEYEYLKNQRKQYFKILNFREWEFIGIDSLDTKTGVKEIKLSGIAPNQKYDYSPQSAIQYQYLNGKAESVLETYTGIVENYKNILVHNPRGGFFWPLFTFPWPSVMFPVAVGNKWKWQWKYDGDSFGDERIRKWDGIIQMDFSYEVVAEETLIFEQAKVQCYKIVANGINEREQIDYKLTYFFNPTLGFVKFVFQPDDETVINLYMTGFKDKCKGAK